MAAVSTTAFFFQNAVTVSPVGQLSYMEQTLSPPCQAVVVVTPQEYDILMGRGNRSNRQPGNVRFRSFVQTYRKVYQSADIPEHKTALTKALIGLAKAPFIYNGHVVAPRFLSINQDLNCWEVVDDEVARRKIAHLLRTKVGSHARSKSN